MYRPPSEMRLADVDRENHTVHLIVNGHLIEAVCEAQENATAIEQVQQTLLKCFFGKSL